MRRIYRKCAVLTIDSESFRAGTLGRAVEVMP
jgi:hypothetical protein